MAKASKKKSAAGTRKVKKKVGKAARRRGRPRTSKLEGGRPAEKVVRTFKATVADLRVMDRVVDRLEAEVGLIVDRGTLIRVFAGVLREYAEELDLKEVRDVETFRSALVDAIRGA